MRGTETNMAYNVTSGSDALRPGIRPPVSDAAQWFTVNYELNLKPSNNVTKCLGVEMNNDQIVASKMIQWLSKNANYASIATWQKLRQFAQITPKIMLV